MKKLIIIGLVAISLTSSLFANQVTVTKAEIVREYGLSAQVYVPAHGCEEYFVLSEISTQVNDSGHLRSVAVPDFIILKGDGTLLATAFNHETCLFVKKTLGY